MGLVDYNSDSDSDTNTPPPAPAPPKKKPLSIPGLNLPAPKAAKAKAPALEGTTTTTTADGKKKITISLPKPSLPAGEEAGDFDEPPSKRARTTGGFSDLSSLLPKPKRKGESGVIARVEEGPGEVVKKRVLGGGAAKKEDYGLVVEHEEELPLPGAEDTEVKEGEKVEVKATVTSFKPSTVGKTRTIQPMSAFRRKGTGAKKPVAVYKPPAPAKVDLFGSGPAAEELGIPAAPTNVAQKQSTYEPILNIRDPTPPPTIPETFTAPVETDPFAHLSAAERRQLFGRNGVDPSTIPMASFNVDAEYDANRRNLELGLAEQVANPVRSIGGGRHQLSSLLNIAQSQKEALEESFAQGRRNRKEAGSKYGW